MNYKHEEPLPECDERHYWHKRFNFAAWLFLVLGLYFVIFTDKISSGLVAITASIGFRLFDSWMEVRHMKWHIRNNPEGENNDGNSTD